LPNCSDGQAPDDTVARGVSSSDVDAREEVVNPLSLDISDKASYINMIGRHK